MLAASDRGTGRRMRQIGLVTRRLHTTPSFVPVASTGPGRRSHCKQVFMLRRHAAASGHRQGGAARCPITGPHPAHASSSAVGEFL
mmetsp:Transcript_9463/g.24619  ORF Transcript_9463/g.24619 Transcript_9463/m.24619 type:complete len:86 (-) Transcript_9463:145-402(-)